MWLYKKGVVIPFKSQAQKNYMFAHEKEIGPKVVNEFAQASKGMKLPSFAPGIPKPTQASGIKPIQSPWVKMGKK